MALDALRRKGKGKGNWRGGQGGGKGNKGKYGNGKESSMWLGDMGNGNTIGKVSQKTQKSQKSGRIWIERFFLGCYKIPEII